MMENFNQEFWHRLRLSFQISSELGVITKNTFSGRDVNFIWEFQNQDGSYLVV